MVTECLCKAAVDSVLTERTLQHQVLQVAESDFCDACVMNKIILFVKGEIGQGMVIWF